MIPLIRKLAIQKNVDPFDLEYAVKSLKCKDENRMIEAKIYEGLVKEKNERIWEVAKRTKK